MRLSEYIDGLKNKRVAVLGIGVSNTPLIKKLLGSGIKVSAFDRNTAEKLGPAAEELACLGADLILGSDYLNYLDHDVIFRTPGLRPDLPQIERCVRRGAVLTSEMEAFFQVCPCKIIAVTGSDGKTTTTTIISELLKKAGYNVHVGGNIGRPLLCGADDMSENDIAVLELSSFQLMTMDKSPDIAVVTNLAPNHLDIHRDMDEYVEAKKNIFTHQAAGGRLVLNADNDITASFAGNPGVEVKYFSRRKEVDGCWLRDGDIYLSGEKLMPTSGILLPGVHNIENYMAAFDAVEGLVPRDIMADIAGSFSGVEHRIELVRTLRGVRYYNDSIASSPTRTIAGLRSFKEKVILIAGGKDKGVPFDSLGTEILKHAKALVLTGLTGPKIRAAVENAPGYDGSLPIVEEEDFKEAVLAASGLASEGDVVILSPASTSFDKFKNFMERGDTFKKIVNELE